MKIRNARRWAPSGGWRYLAALAGFGVAFAIQRVLQPLFGTNLPDLFFIVAVLLSEFFLGMGPALMLAAASTLALDYDFVEPYGQLGVPNRGDLTALLSHLSLNLLAIGLIEWLRRVQYQAVLLAEVSRSRYEILLRVDNERLLAEDSAKLTNRLLRNFTAHLDRVMYIGNAAIGYEFIGEMVRRDADLPLADLRGGAFLYALHPEDAEVMEADLNEHGERDLRERLTRHLRVRRKNGSYQRYDCELEYFKAHSGVFVVLRKLDEAGETTPATGPVGRSTPMAAVPRVVSVLPRVASAR